jgi:acyl carrier protein
MTPEEVRTQVLQCLLRVAPEVNPSDIRPAVPLRDQVDIDSMDFLRFVIELDEALHVAVPESDYREIATLDGCVSYLTARLPTPTA